jgi:Domain of unknown function (DUF305)
MRYISWRCRECTGRHATHDSASALLHVAVPDGEQALAARPAVAAFGLAKPSAPRMWRAVAALSSVMTLGALASGNAAPASASTAEAPFLAENQAAMDKMMAGMRVVQSGNVDRDFAAMMIPHHQGAIDMAQAELRYGHNEQLRRIAQEIIVDQLQEIAAMRLAVGRSLPPPVGAPDQPSNLASPVSTPIPSPSANTQESPR